MERLTTKDAAEFLGFAEGTVENWRLDGRGPPYYKTGGKVFYLKEDLIEWFKSGKQETDL